MGSKRAVSTYAVTGLEVSSVDIQLTEVFSQRAVPAHRSNIPKQANVDRWPHLKWLKIPELDVGIKLLIGMSMDKSDHKSEEVITSVDD